MDRIDPEPLGLGCLLFAGEFIRCQALQGLGPAAEVVGVDGVAPVLPELRVIARVQAFDPGLPEGPVHPLDLPVGPRMLDLGPAVSGALLIADPPEDMLEGIPV